MNWWLIIGLTAMLSCSQVSHQEEATLYWYHVYYPSQPDKVLRETLNGVLKYQSEGDSVFYTFGNLAYQFVEESLIVESTVCPLMSKEVFEFKGTANLVGIYSFDHPDIADEESYYFMIDQKIIALYNWSMGPLLIFDYNNDMQEVDSLYSFILKKR